MWSKHIPRLIPGRYGARISQTLKTALHPGHSLCSAAFLTNDNDNDNDEKNRMIKIRRIIIIRIIIIRIITIIIIIRRRMRRIGIKIRITRVWHGLSNQPVLKNISSFYDTLRIKVNKRSKWKLVLEINGEKQELRSNTKQEREIGRMVGAMLRGTENREILISEVINFLLRSNL